MADFFGGSGSDAGPVGVPTDAGALPLVGAADDPLVGTATASLVVSCVAFGVSVGAEAKLEIEQLIDTRVRKIRANLRRDERIDHLKGEILCVEWPSLYHAPSGGTNFKSERPSWLCEQRLSASGAAGL
ncbi:MAG: hypothetical protein M1482_01080 [Chloroflexi bacterium]|nr:hypothetical protein [Chloroflexota bacterium]